MSSAVDNQFARMAATYHTCGGMPGCAACYTELHAKVAAAEKRAEEVEQACEKADDDFRVMHDQLTERVNEQAQILRLTALAAQHIGGSATLPLTVGNLFAHLAAANAEIARLRGVGTVPERVKAHQELDACLDEAGRAEYGWLHDHDLLSHQTDRVYRHVHNLAVLSFAELKSKSIAERVKRFRDTVGALHGGNRNPDRCICQTLETGHHADTPHVHYQEPPFSCGPM